MTTVTKAKALRVYIEPLITRAKEDTSHNRRQVFRRLQDNATVSELFTEVSAQVGDRPGGYTRVVKLGRRAGDGAPMAVIELVDYNDVQPEGTKSSSRRTRRGGGKGRRRGRSKSDEAKQAAAATTSTESDTDIDTVEASGVAEAVDEPTVEEQAPPGIDGDEAGDEAEAQVETAQEDIDESEVAVKDQDDVGSSEAEVEPPGDLTERSTAEGDELKSKPSDEKKDEASAEPEASADEPENDDKV